MSTQPPPYPTFQEGNRLRDELTADKLRAMAQAIVFEVIGGSADFVPGKGTSLKINRRNIPESRCYVATSVTSTALPATILLDAITYDIPSTRTASVIAELSGGVLTLTKPGFYKVAYTGNIYFSLAGATTATPGHVEVEAKLRIGGVDLDTTRSNASAPLTPNFDNFVKAEAAIEQSVNLDGVTGKTVAITPVSVAACEGSMVDIGGAPGYNPGSGPGPITLDSPNVFDVTNPCVSVLSDDELDGDGKLGVTLDSGQDIDVTTNLTRITDSDPSGYGYGTVTSQALIRVIRNATTGDIKILDGVTERSPTLEIYATVANGAANCLTATLSILKL
jgi:hypothetical protein